MILLVVFIISFSLSATEVCGWQRKYPKYDGETSVRRKGLEGSIMGSTFTHHQSNLTLWSQEEEKRWQFPLSSSPQGLYYKYGH
ncbi:hypothetical protein WN943_013656 [Citrus x changshan-huyou]